MTTDTVKRAVTIVTLVAALGRIVAMIFGAYRFMDMKHAQADKVLKTEIELRKDIVDRDLKKNAEARVYYKDLQRHRGLEPPEQARLEYLEEQMERKYEEMQILQQKEMELK